MSQTNLERSLLWLDDLAPGQVFVSGSRMITRDEIVSFAAMFDPQPFHIDEEAAKVSLFKGLAASGIHTFGASKHRCSIEPSSRHFPKSNCPHDFSSSLGEQYVRFLTMR